MAAFAAIFCAVALSSATAFAAPAEPYLIKDINPGIDGSSPEMFASLGATVYFNAYEDSLGHELWKSDGTPGGTSLVKDIYPGNDDSSPEEPDKRRGYSLLQRLRWHQRQRTLEIGRHP